MCILGSMGMLVGKVIHHWHGSIVENVKVDIPKLEYAVFKNPKKMNSFI